MHACPGQLCPDGGEAGLLGGSFENRRAEMLRMYKMYGRLRKREIFDACVKSAEQCR